MGRRSVWGGRVYGAEGSMPWGGREYGADGRLGRTGGWGGGEYGRGRKGVWGGREYGVQGTPRHTDSDLHFDPQATTFLSPAPGGIYLIYFMN
jgi:hypothetical protein